MPDQAYEACQVAPEGWWCHRPGGHDGPCAAHPGTERSADYVQALTDAVYVLGRARRSWEREPDDNPAKARNLYAYSEAERVLGAWADLPSRMDGHLGKRAAGHG